jgi:hypothetical protein
MKNTARLVLSLVAALPILAVTASAAPSVDWDQSSVGAVALSPAGESLAADIKALSDNVSNESATHIIYGVPQKMQNAFAGIDACSVMDAQYLTAVSLDEAVQALGPCAQGLSQRYGVTVTIEQGPVGVDGGRQAVQGIVFHVPANIAKGNHILMDLSFSIRDQRHSTILGLPAGIVSGKETGLQD